MKISLKKLSLENKSIHTNTHSFIHLFISFTRTVFVPSVQTNQNQQTSRRIQKAVTQARERYRAKNGVELIRPRV